MTRFFTIVYGTRDTACAMQPFEGTIDQAQARVDQVMTEQGLKLNWINLTESTDEGMVLVETE